MRLFIANHCLVDRTAEIMLWPHSAIAVVKLTGGGGGGGGEVTMGRRRPEWPHLAIAGLSYKQYALIMKATY